MSAAVSIMSPSLGSGREAARWDIWLAAFCCALGAHAAVALLMLERDMSASGGAMPQPVLEVYELQMPQVLGDQPGESDVLSPGEIVEEASEADTAETLEPGTAAALAPTIADTLRTAEAEVLDPAAPDMLAPVTADEPAQGPVGEALPSPAPQDIEDAEAASASAVPPSDAESPPAPAAAMSSAPPPASAAEAPDAPAAPIQAEAIESLSAAAEPVTPQMESMTGDVTETADLAPLPRPRPAEVPVEVLREYERQLREAEEQRVAEQRRGAETRQAREREAAERQQAAERRQAARRAERAERAAASERGRQAAPAKTSRTDDRKQTAAPPRAQARGGGPSSAGRSDAAVGKAATSSYQRRVYAHLQRHKRFPQGERQGGTVTVRFTLSASGAASGIGLAGSSGNSTLDRAALDMVRRASPFPRFPPEIGRATLSFVVPVDYSMR